MLYWSYKYICVWFLWKWIDIRKNKIKWGNIGTLPSAGRWQRALPSAGRWQRGHVSSTCKIWAGLFGLFAIWQQMANLFAICWQTAKHSAFAICWQMAKYAVSLLTGLTPLRGFAICQLMAKAHALCHQPAEGKEAFATGFQTNRLPFAGRWQSMPLAF